MGAPTVSAPFIRTVTLTMATTTRAGASSKVNSFKLVLLGESAVGKSSLVLQFVKGQFDDYRESTIGAAFLAQTVKVESGDFVKFEIWDTAGQERYKVRASRLLLLLLTCAAELVVHRCTVTR